MKISIIGATGLVGSRTSEILSSKYEIEDLNSSTGFDITDTTSVSQLQNSGSEVVILMAAMANVDGCEGDKLKGESGDAWKLNVEGPRNVGVICQATGKKLIYVSTDFVFDGELPVGDSYTEEDTTHAVNWYGETKLEGEKVVEKLSTPWVIARLAYPYRQNFEKKKDFVRTIKGLLEEGHKISVVTDHEMCPTYIDDFAKALDLLIEKEATGIYHIVGSTTITPFDAAQKIASTFGLDTSKVSPTTRAEFFAGKAPRPRNLSLRNDKIVSLGAKMRTFEEGLRELKKLT